jgi:hypothetical protein
MKLGKVYAKKVAKGSPIVPPWISVKRFRGSFPSFWAYQVDLAKNCRAYSWIYAALPNFW